MKAFYGIPELKEHYLGRTLYHIQADHLVKGVGWKQNGVTKGCAIGCSLEKYDHAAYETELGIPEWLAIVEDTIFEGMSLEKSKTWPYDFLAAVNVGADLEKIKIPFLILICESVLEYVQDPQNEQQRLAVEGVIKALKTGQGLDAAWDAAGAAARAAVGAAWAAAGTAARAAVGAAGAAAQDAAWASAQDAAGDAAWDAAGDAARAARAARAAEAAKYDYFADELLKLMRGCK